MVQSKKDAVIAVIEEVLGVAPGTVTEETKAQDLEEWDSLTQVMMIGALEEKLGIVIDLEQAAEIASVREILDCAERSGL